MAVVVYDHEVFELSALEFGALEENLKELGAYGFEDTEHKTEWIVYEFLKS